MDSTPLTLPGPDSLGIDRMQFFRDCESGGAWPFLVRGVNCLLNCDNGRDLCLVIAGRAVLCVCVRGGGVRGGEGERDRRGGEGGEGGRGRRGAGGAKGEGLGGEGGDAALAVHAPACVCAARRAPPSPPPAPPLPRPLPSLALAPLPLSLRSLALFSLPRPARTRHASFTGTIAYKAPEA